MLGFLGGIGVKNLPANAEDMNLVLDWEDPLRRKEQPTPVFLPGESHGQRSLAGYSPRGHKEPDMTKHYTQHSTASILARKTPRTEEPGGCQCVRSQGVGHNLVAKQQQLHVMLVWSPGCVLCPEGSVSQPHDSPKLSKRCLDSTCLPRGLPG